MENMYNEQWRAVKGFEGRYAVSNLGRVKSVERTVIRGNGRKQHIREKILKPQLSGEEGNQYLRIDLCKNGKRKRCKVHRLVAEAFIPNPNNYPIINHKIEGDEGRLINTVDNLEWCDYLYNNTYGTARERQAKAMTNGKLSKKVYQYTLAGELVKEWQSTMEVQRQMGWSNGHISDCCNGKRKSAYGFVWSYTLL